MPANEPDLGDAGESRRVRRRSSRPVSQGAGPGPSAVPARGRGSAAARPHTPRGPLLGARAGNTLILTLPGPLPPPPAPVRRPRAGGIPGAALGRGRAGLWRPLARRRSEPSVRPRCSADTRPGPDRRQRLPRPSRPPPLPTPRTGSAESRPGRLESRGRSPAPSPAACTCCRRAGTGPSLRGVGAPRRALAILLRCQNFPLSPPPLLSADKGGGQHNRPAQPAAASRLGAAGAGGGPGRPGGPRGARAEDAGAPRRCPPYIGLLAAPAGCRTWPIHRLL